jgi:transcriptional regulator with XRE-family HTH domain
MNSKIYISENIDYLIRKSRFSQKEFGDLFQLKAGVVSQYVKNISYPKIETIQKICSYFEITIDDFINRSLEEIKINQLKEPGSEYKINSKESEIVNLLKNTIKDKDKIIANLEEQVMYYRYPNEKSSGS